MLEKAIRIAAQAHSGQKDKAGAPYILHPLRVMMKMDTEAEMITAVLHDVIEDSPCTLETLRSEGFSEDIVDALDCLSKRSGEVYEEFIARIHPNPLAVRVKLADLEDNMDADRFADVTDADTKRISKYQRAYAVLKQ